MHEPVHGAVVVGDREQVGDADEDDEQVAREAGEDRRPRRLPIAVPTMNAATMPSRPMLIGRSVPMTKIATSTRIDTTSWDISRSPLQLPQCVSDDLHGMARGAPRAVRDLLAAGHARRGDQRLRGLSAGPPGTGASRRCASTARSALPRSRRTRPCRSSRRRARRPRRRGCARAARRSRRCPPAPSGGSGRGTGSAAGRVVAAAAVVDRLDAAAPRRAALRAARRPRSPSSCTCSSRSVSRQRRLAAGDRRRSVSEPAAPSAPRPSRWHRRAAPWRCSRARSSPPRSSRTS